MRAIVSFQYEGSVKTRSAATHRHLILSERFEADIAEADEDEAPVAVEWQVSPRFEAANPRFTRFHNGSHYRQVVDGDIGDAATLLARLSGNDNHIVPFSSGYILSRVFGSLASDDPKITGIERSDREGAFADARELVDDLLVVGEKLFLRCPEPCFTLVNDQLLVTTSTPPEGPYRGNVPRPFVDSVGVDGHWSRFSLLEPDAALAAQSMRAGADIGLPAFTVSLPESLTTGRIDAALHEAVRMALNLAGGRTPLGEVHPAFLKSVLPLSELCWGKDLCDLEGDLLCEGIQTVLSGAARAGMKTAGDGDCIRLAIERWENRPIVSPAALGAFRP